MPGRTLSRRDRLVRTIKWHEGQVKQAATPEAKFTEAADFVRSVLPGLPEARAQSLADEASCYLIQLAKRAGKFSQKGDQT